MEHPGVRFPPPLIFAGILLLGGLIDRRVPISLPSFLSPYGLTTGWVLVILGCALAGWAVYYFMSRKTSMIPHRPASNLVTGGPYRFSRNPMYVAISLIHVGISMIYDTIWPVMLLPLVWIILYLYVIRREERYLTNAFGEEYTSYCARVGRWL